MNVAAVTVIAVFVVAFGAFLNRLRRVTFQGGLVLPTSRQSKIAFRRVLPSGEQLFSVSRERKQLKQYHLEYQGIARHPTQMDHEALVKIGFAELGSTDSSSESFAMRDESTA